MSTIRPYCASALLQLSSLSILLLTSLAALTISGCGDSESTIAPSESIGTQSTAAPVPETGAVSDSVVAAETAASSAKTAVVANSALSPEKATLKFGFIKLTDCAPLVIAREKGFFEEEGLQVEVIAQPNWKTLLDNVINGELDGAHMLSGQPIAATIGIGTKAHIVTACTMDLNGNGITVSNSVWEQMQSYDESLRTPNPTHPIKATALKPVVDQMLAEGKKLQMGIVFPVSTHNYELRYWLASAGIHPGMYSESDTGGRTDAQVELSVTPPPMMPATLEAGNIQGYCVGEPWNQQAVAKGIGVPVTTNYDIYRNKAEKVLGVTKQWADENPQTHIAVVKDEQTHQYKKAIHNRFPFVKLGVGLRVGRVNKLSVFNYFNFARLIRL